MHESLAVSAWADKDAAAVAVPGFGRLGRAPGAAWFLLLAIVWGWPLPSLLSDVRAAPESFSAWAQLLSQVCTVTFLATLGWLVMARPPATARRTGLYPRLVALAGTYGIWLVIILPRASLSPAMAILSASLTLSGGLLIVLSILHLGRSFSIGPQARRLITQGPYALVRHPLYAAEEIALIGVTLHVVWYAAVPFLLAHLALQALRMGYEERLLRGVFPEYEAYAQRTARWIPGLW